MNTPDCCGELRVNGSSNVFTVCKSGCMILEENKSSL